eukprot:TRINITY_DN101502_c0_g1_i1.p1 TRINITY_DN101502_c0_g1~~TRINITY_DN101502_c0_g1_i1.p1  ORF type:complete len:891 (-),score=182.57 TRINITY_DN101502_c0_g1_i1:150-2822(-)
MTSRWENCGSVALGAVALSGVIATAAIWARDNSTPRLRTRDGERAAESGSRQDETIKVKGATGSAEDATAGSQAAFATTRDEIQPAASSSARIAGTVSPLRSDANTSCSSGAPAVAVAASSASSASSQAPAPSASPPRILGPLDGKDSSASCSSGAASASPASPASAVVTAQAASSSASPVSYGQSSMPWNRAWPFSPPPSQAAGGLWAQQAPGASCWSSSSTAGVGGAGNASSNTNARLTQSNMSSSEKRDLDMMLKHQDRQEGRIPPVLESLAARAKARSQQRGQKARRVADEEPLEVTAEDKERQEAALRELLSEEMDAEAAAAAAAAAAKGATASKKKGKKKTKSKKSKEARDAAGAEAAAAEVAEDEVPSPAGIDNDEDAQDADVDTEAALPGHGSPDLQPEMPPAQLEASLGDEVDHPVDDDEDAAAEADDEEVNRTEAEEVAGQDADADAAVPEDEVSADMEAAAGDDEEPLEKAPAVVAELASPQEEDGETMPMEHETGEESALAVPPSLDAEALEEEEATPHPPSKQEEEEEEQEQEQERAPSKMLDMHASTSSDDTTDEVKLPKGSGVKRSVLTKALTPSTDGSASRQCSEAGDDASTVMDANLCISRSLTSDSGGGGGLIEPLDASTGAGRESRQRPSRQRAWADLTDSSDEDLSVGFGFSPHASRPSRCVAAALRQSGGGARRTGASGVGNADYARSGSDDVLQDSGLSSARRGPRQPMHLQSRVPAKEQWYDGEPSSPLPSCKDGSNSDGRWGSSKAQSQSPRRAPRQVPLRPPGVWGGPDAILYLDVLSPSKDDARSFSSAALVAQDEDAEDVSSVAGRDAAVRQEDADGRESAELEFKDDVLQETANPVRDGCSAAVVASEAEAGITFDASLVCR